MNKSALAAALIALAYTSLAGCKEEAQAQPTKNVQAEKAKAAANSIHFTENAEIENIKNRLQLTANPGLLGYIILLNETGQPVMYSAVKGKITSGSKRLTDPRKVVYQSGGANGNLTAAVTDTPSDEGTFGSSDPYIYFWTPAGQYIQWNGKYLYSDKPFRLNVNPIVINIEKANG